MTAPMRANATGLPERNGLTLEDRTRSAIDDTYALARLLDVLTNGLDMEIHYLVRQLQHNAAELRSSFIAFRNDVDNELRAAKGFAV